MGDKWKETDYAKSFEKYRSQTTETTAALVQAVLRYVPSSLGARVIDIGCGTGLLLSKVNAKKRVGVDVSSRLLGQLKNNSLQLVRTDAENLPFKEGSFDLVYSVNLLEHVPHPDTVVSEGIGALKRGGKLLLITPNGDMSLFLEIADKLKMKAPEGPHRFLTSNGIKSIIPKAKVKVVERRKLVLFPKGPRFILDTLEGLEPIIALGFFHLIVLEKI